MASAQKENIHARTTLGLPSLNSRLAARAQLERDVEDYLSRGGQIHQVTTTESFLADKSLADISASPGTLKHVNRPSQKATRKRVVWTPAMLDKIRTEFHAKPKKTLADELGITVAHLYNKAASMHLTGDRNPTRRIEWTEEKLKALREGWSTKAHNDLSEEIGASKSTLYLKARELGLSRQYQPVNP